MSACAPVATSSPVPEWLRGLWRRRSMRYADGRVDETTTVYWLQTASAFADIRLPAARPVSAGRSALADFDDAELLLLARQAGFAGWTEVDGDRCLWHREVDFQPPTGVPDEGVLQHRSRVLIETGVHEAYLEIWEHLDCGSRPDLAVPSPPPGARLIVLGNAFLYVHDRRLPLATAPSLEALAGTAAQPRAALLRLLDCEISFGRCSGGRAAWEITRSTLPFREGRSLLADPADLPSGQPTGAQC